jgi:hypothetical protein
VVSDLRFKPKDKTATRRGWPSRSSSTGSRWRAAQPQRQPGEATLQAELARLPRDQHPPAWPFYRPSRTYFDYLYKKDRDAWFVLDPVITVHPDEVFFECFSQDESTYGRLGASVRGVHQHRRVRLRHDQHRLLGGPLQRVPEDPPLQETCFEVDPSGFEVQTTARGQRSPRAEDRSARLVGPRLPAGQLARWACRRVTFDLHPMDVHNLCFVLRRNKEKRGPRSDALLLKPGQPVKVVFEPWNLEVVSRARRTAATSPHEIRVWGRRRLFILERLIQLARKFTVHLLGQGLPSFYVADLGHMSFTLGLSGWTANDWSRPATSTCWRRAPRSTTSPSAASSTA